MEITMKTIFGKLNFGILSMRARVRVIITGKIPWSWFLENINLESERFRKFPKIFIPKNFPLYGNNILNHTCKIHT